MDPNRLDGQEGFFKLIIFLSFGGSIFAPIAALLVVETFPEIFHHIRFEGELENLLILGSITQYYILSILIAMLPALVPIFMAANSITFWLVKMK